MKKTTYMMIALFFLGIVAMFILVAYSAARYEKEKRIEMDNRPVIGAKAEISEPLDGFSCVEFCKEENSFYLDIKGFKGFAILESDTVSVPEFVAAADWMPYLRRSVDQGVLSVSIDRDSIVKTLMGDDYKNRYNCVEAVDFVIATIKVPHGMLKDVRSDMGEITVYLDSVRAGKIRSDIRHRLVLNRSRIDTLESVNKKMRELTLDGSAIGMLELKDKGTGFTINFTDSTSTIGSYTFNSEKGKNGMKIGF